MSVWAYPGLKYPSLVQKPYEETLTKILEYNGLKMEDLKKRNRKRELVETRMLCAWVLKHEHFWTLKRIGILFNQDHTTIIHLLQRVKSLCQTDENLRQQASLFCPELLAYKKLY